MTSWAHEKLGSLDLFVEPRKGLTRELLRIADIDNKGHIVDAALALFSGPQGVSAPVGEYESILIIADGFGMASFLAYLKQLVHDYRARKVRTRRIRVIWQVQVIGKHKMGRKCTYGSSRG